MIFCCCNVVTLLKVIDVTISENTEESTNVTWYEPPVEKKKSSAKGKPKREEVEPSLFPVEIRTNLMIDFEFAQEAMKQLKLFLTEHLQQKTKDSSQQPTPRFKLYYHQTDQKDYVIQHIYPKLKPCLNQLTSKIHTYLKVLEEQKQEKLFEPEIDEYLKLKPYEISNLEQIYNNPVLYLAKLLKEK